METKYLHKVNYYETDAMGVTHHSNYIKWMEEARVELMSNFGYSYKKLESIGISSPVLGYSCDIKKSTYFDDVVEIYPEVVEYNSVRLRVKYIMKINDVIIAEGETKHCFLNSKGVPIRLNKECLELDEKLKMLIK